MSYQFEHSWRHERERLAGIEGELFARGYAAFLGCMVRNGNQADLGLHLGEALRKLGLRDVQVRGWVDEWTGAGPSPSVYLRAFEKIRDRVVARGELSSGEVERFLAGIQAPEFRAITAVHFAAWGQRVA